MAKGSDDLDLDLIGLFGLSAEEAAGLGLAPAGAQERLDVHDTAPPVTDVRDSRPPASVRDAEPRPVFPLGERASNRDASGPCDLFADDRAFLSMLEEEVAAVDGRDEREENGLPATAAAIPTVVTNNGVTVPIGREPDDGENRGVAPANTGEAEGQTSWRTDEILPTSAIDGADDIDLAALFGLSAEEAAGLGLATTPNSAQVGGSDTQDQGAQDVPIVLTSAMPTMPLRAITTQGSDPDEDVFDEPKQETAPGDINSASGLAEPWQPPLSPRNASADDDSGAAAYDIAAYDIIAPASQESAGHQTHEDGEHVEDTAHTEGAGAGYAEGIDPLLLEAFAEESAELLDGLHIELENLESNPGDKGALLEIRRIVHTIKGGAKMCLFEHVVTLTHASENLLDLAADASGPLGMLELRALFACEPLLRALVHAALSGHNDSAAVAAAAELAVHFNALCEGVDGGARRENDPPDIVTAAMTVPSDTTPDTPLPSQGGQENSIPWSHSGDGARADNGLNSTRDTGTAVEQEEHPRLPVSGREEQLPVAGRDEHPRLTAAPPPTPATVDDEPEGAAVTSGGERGATAERGGRRGRESINVDLSKVDAVVAKVTEMAAHRSSYQGMVGQLMETTGEARSNILRLHQLALSIGNECATAQPVSPERRQGMNDLDLESYNSLATLALQLQEAVADQQALIEKVYDTITNHWSLRATESRVDADLQSALMNIRLIPLANMRVRLDGVVRQAAQATGKSVRWQLHGGTVAVEKNVFDRLFEPLMHLLRNAVDHGLETTEGRHAAGKPATGVIIVTAKQQDNHVVITIEDDGAGIIPAKIVAIAIERGVVAAEAAAVLSPRQKIELIFTPGFSTAASVSHLSGRGVGMDAVREACLRMGGSISVDSREGLGTTFTMRLPLSLSVTRGLIVRDSGSYMAVPVGQISALHLVPAADIVDAPGVPGGHVARIDGHNLPIYNLPRPSGAAPVAYVQHGEVHVLQVPHEGGSIGLIIEDVLDEEEMLIKAVPPLLRGVKTLLGSYVLPDGAVAPVVNLPQLLADLRPTVMLHEEREEQAERGPVALVVDDSMSMRVALSGTLQGAGFTVLTARDGQEAMDVLKREGLPSIITLDIEMPRMDGLETLFAIRQMPGAGDVPIFMMTSRGGTKHRRAAEQLGATHYFTKPYRDSELANAARAACALGA